MKKILSIVLFLLALSGCAVIDFIMPKRQEAFFNCPNVVIPRKSAYLTQVNYGFDDFQVQVSGFEGYCYYDDLVKSNKAVITPIFEVYRLAPSKDSQVDYMFYTKTEVGPPEYLGTWTHHQSAIISQVQKKIVFKGKRVELRIPSKKQENFVIELGLVQTKKEIEFNNKTFDVEYDYIDLEHLTLK